MSEPDDGQRPALRIVRGDPTPEELAAIAAVTALAASAAGPAPSGDTASRRGRWNDPAARVRRYWRPGPGGWTAAGR